MAQGPELTAYFASGEVLFRMGDRTIRMRLEGAAAARIEGIERMAGKVNFLSGTESQWRTGEAMYGGVAYRGVYPGIDMVYNGTVRNLKSEFQVAPFADPSRIRVRYEGADEVRIEASGALAIRLGNREFREDAPVIYQVRRGARVAVAGRFAMEDDGTLGFRMESYDRALPLVIDPVVYSTLLGGASTDSATAIALDGAGAAYVAGFTASLDFPTVNAAQTALGGSNDIFVAKLNASGNGLVYCTYLGGRGDDRALAIAVDGTGSAYVTGSTTSANFPVRNPVQTKLMGAKNAFLVKLNPAGNMTVFSTYLGGSGSDTGTGIAVDGAGNVYVTGDSTSSNFPTTAYQRTNRGGQDAFVVKMAAAGAPMMYGTYLGGAYEDHGAAIAVDASGSAYVTGSTQSPDFPVMNAYQSASGGGQDAFVARFDESGGALVFSTYLGGTGGSLGYPETGQAIALDAQGNAYIAGATSSPNFPLANAAQTVRRGSLDAFVAKLTAAGALVNSTYVGGAGIDIANAIAVDGSGSVYFAGQTLSTDLPVAGAFQQVSGGSYDAFVGRLAATGDSIPFLSYLGGTGSESANGIAVDGSGNIYVAGLSQSTNFPTLNGFQTINGGTYGGFVVKLSAASPPAVVSATPASGSGASQTFAFQFSNTAGATGLTTVGALFQATPSTANACGVIYNRAANTLMVYSDAGTTSSITITPGSGTLQNTQCTIDGAGSSVSIAGTTLTLNLAVTFQAGFSGAKNIYLQANSSSGATGWVAKGTWTITAGPPQAVSVSPSTGSGSSQSFSFLFTDPRGYAAINTASMMIGTSLAGSSTCYLYYARAANAVYLANDAGNAWLAPVTLGGTGTAQNSQCSVAAAGSGATSSGNNLTLVLAISFKSAYVGAKNIYMEVHDGTDSGWQNRGTWTVVDNGPPAPVSVSPASGSGSSQSFSFQFSDPRGYAAINTASIMIGTSLAGTNNCYLYFARAANAVYLANDAGNAWLAPVILGATGTVQNNQCAVAGTGSSASGSGNTLTLTLAVSFKSGYVGAKNVYMQVYDGMDSGWSQKGSWTVTAPNILEPLTVTPGSGSGSTSTFAFQFNDPNGYASIYSASIMIGSSLAGTGNCYMYYARSGNAIYLANDAGNAWLAPAVLGTNTTIQNSQCAINVGSSSSSGNGTVLTLNLAMTFKAAYTGTKKIFMEVYDNADSGWSEKGSWIVP